MDRVRTYNITKLISIYVGMTLTGILLILIAVYNASHDLEIHYKISSLYQYTLENIDSNGNFSSLQSKDPARKYFLLNASGPFKPLTTYPGFVIDQPFLASTRRNELGGYSENSDTGSSSHMIWALVPVKNTQNKILVMDKYESDSGKFLLLSYQNRLLIPAIFFVWLTVWGSFILRNLVRDIQAQNKAVEHMALHDALTGLANRTLFSEKLEELWHYATREKLPFTIVMVDLDKFKEVNDAHGHDIGDQLLKIVAKRFRQSVRKYDIIARLGGDEFQLLLPNTDTHASKPVCTRLLHELIQPYLIQDLTVTIGASLGIATFPLDTDNLNTLNQLADKAMYTAKKAGGGLYFHKNN